MKVIHTYSDKRGVIWKELMYTQYLSAILAKKHYGNITFYGDKDTCKMVEDLGLPYDEINSDILKSDDASTWSLPKIKVYQAQREEFLHIDTDTFIFNKIEFQSYDKDYMFSHKDMDIFKNQDNKDIMKDLYMTWFFNMDLKGVSTTSDYPFREYAKKLKEYLPKNIIQHGIDAYKSYYFMNNTYTNLFFDLLENVGKEIFDNVNFQSIPNMNVTYVKNTDKFSKACSESLKHYYQNKERIDKEFYGPCYIEQFMIHTQLRYLDSKYKKSSKKGKNFIFGSIPMLQLDDHNNTADYDKIKFPLRFNYVRDEHFKCSCCGEKLISALSKPYKDEIYKTYNIESADEILNFLEQEFNGFLHVTYMKWYDIFQVYIIHKLRKEVGDDKIREIHKYYQGIYPKRNLALKSTGETLYTKLTGFVFDERENGEDLI